MAGGFLDPSYLKTLPATAKTFALALTRDLASKRRRISLPPWPAIPLTQKRWDAAARRAAVISIALRYMMVLAWYKYWLVQRYGRRYD
jgi:hypothetical protein